MWGVWPYRDPGRLVADRIGVAGARTTITAMGGNQVYELVVDTADRISRGELDVAVVCAAETLRTRRRDRAGGRRTEYLAEPEQATPDELLGDDKPLSTPREHAIGVDVAVNFYAMAETAIRHRTRRIAGRSPAPDRVDVGETRAMSPQTIPTPGFAPPEPPTRSHASRRATDRSPRPTRS